MASNIFSDVLATADPFENNKNLLIINNIKFSSYIFHQRVETLETKMA